MLIPVPSALSLFARWKENEKRMRYESQTCSFFLEKERGQKSKKAPPPLFVFNFPSFRPTRSGTVSISDVIRNCELFRSFACQTCSGVSTCVKRACYSPRLLPFEISQRRSVSPCRRNFHYKTVRRCLVVVSDSSICDVGGKFLVEKTNRKHTWERGFFPALRGFARSTRALRERERYVNR